MPVEWNEQGGVDPNELTPLQNERLVLTLYYEGPWARACHWLWKMRFEDPEDYEEVPVGKLRDWLGSKCLALDHRWRERYVRSFTRPHDRWRVR